MNLSLWTNCILKCEHLTSVSRLPMTALSPGPTHGCPSASGTTWKNINRQILWVLNSEKQNKAKPKCVHISWVWCRLCHCSICWPLWVFLTKQTTEIPNIWWWTTFVINCIYLQNKLEWIDFGYVRLFLLHRPSYNNRCFHHSVRTMSLNNQFFFRNVLFTWKVFSEIHFKIYATVDRLGNVAVVMLHVISLCLVSGGWLSSQK